MPNDPTSMAYKLFRRLATKRPSLEDGLSLTLETIVAAPGGKSWASLRPDELAQGLDPFVRWLTTLVKKAPPPASTAALWFEIPEVDLNPAYTSVSAYDVFDPLDEFYGMDEGRTWPEDKRGITLPIGLQQLPELEHALAAVGWRDPDMPSERSELMTPRAFALTWSYITLLVLHGLPRAPIDHLTRRDGGLAVTVGWASGDVFPFGMLSPTGWSAVRKPTKAERAARPSPYALDPESALFDPDVYVRHGGDINARDADGETVLMRNRHSDPAVIRRIVHLGADVNAKDNRGATTLSYFVGGDPDVLELLLQAGADVSKGGRQSVGLFERAVDDGRCTARNLELLVERGVSPHFSNAEGRNAFHIVSWGGCLRPADRRQLSGLVEYLASLGIDVNKPDNAGITPLWVSLIAHIEELDDIKGWLTGRFVPEPHTVYFSRRERTAMLLLEAGADPNARLSHSPHKRIPAGATPLMLSRYDRLELHRALLKHGADPHAVSADGKTALDYARAAARSKRCDRDGAAAVSAMLERAMKRRSPTSPAKPAKPAKPRRA